MIIKSICCLQALQELGLDTTDLVDEEPSIFHSSQPTSQEHRKYNSITLHCLIVTN